MIFRLREDFNLETALQTVLSTYLENKYPSVFDISYPDLQLLFKSNVKHQTFEERLNSEEHLDPIINDILLEEIRTFLQWFGMGEHPYEEGHFVDLTNELESIFNNHTRPQPYSIEDKKLKFEEIFNKYLSFEKWAVYSTNPYFTPLRDKLLQIDRIYFKSEYFGETSEREKLHWLGTPSQLGYLLNELAEMGYIEFPVTRNERSYAKYAQIAIELFKVDTSKEYLANQINPEKCSLSDTNKLKFKIQNIK